MSQNQEKEIKKFNLFIGDEFSKIISAPSINDINKSLRYWIFSSEKFFDFCENEFKNVII